MTKSLVERAYAVHAEIFPVSVSDFLNADPDSWHQEYMDTALREGQTREEAAEGLAGWYVWCCLPGCLPDSEACGPYYSEQDAAAAYLNE